jgi:hypothetical protein
MGARGAVPEENQMANDDIGAGTRDDPWVLQTPPGTSAFEAWREPDADPPALVVQVGTTQLRYHLRCLDDLQAMLTTHGDWMPLGNADEQKEAKSGTVEAWGRSADNPMGGWYGFKSGSGWPRSNTAPATTACAPAETRGSGTPAVPTMPPWPNSSIRRPWSRCTSTASPASSGPPPA